MEHNIAHVALNIPKANLFSYLIPSELQGSIRPGHLVYVPLKNRKLIGIIIEVSGLKAEKTKGIENVKDLKEILALPYPDPILDQVLLDLAKWVSDYYLCPIGITIRALIPTGAIPERISTKEGVEVFRPKGKEKLVSYIHITKPKEEIARYIESAEKRAPKQSAILKSLMAKGGKASVFEISQKGHIPNSSIKTLAGKGLIRVSKERVFRDPHIHTKTQKKYTQIILNTEQQSALEQLRSALGQGGFAPFLLHGITGSGKTEVYLQLVLNALEKGLQAIVLVPEIAITHQLIDRFKYYLGDRIAILHSHLSDGERLDEWLRIKKGLANVVIGARSAIFAPLAKLGVIICDEEHDSSYKQEAPPRYHGRDVAIMRAKMTGCLVCLGSATPSLESFYNAQIRKYQLLSLCKRVTTHQQLPAVNMIDLKEEYDKNKAEDPPMPIFSKTLLDSIKEALRKEEQVLIFQNRRGHSPFLLCPKCAYVPKCPNCSVSLTYHSTDNILRCHYCDFQNPSPGFCPNCHEIPLKYMGHGTQKVEKEIKDIFQLAHVARMDRDSTTRKGAHYEILSCFEKGETDILVGTQMVTKGLDLPNITLVGVIGIDHILNLPDFRATERVFQMVTQVAGRAGRGDELGRVLIQTFYPNHYSLCFASSHDFTGFYNREIGFRRRLSYPPFSRLICIIIKGRQKKDTRAGASFLGKYIKQNMNPSQIRCLGPSMAPLFRLRGMYRYQIMLKAKDHRVSHALIQDALTQFSKQGEFRGIKIDVDVDPVNLL